VYSIAPQRSQPSTPPIITIYYLPGAIQATLLLRCDLSASEFSVLTHNYVYAMHLFLYAYMTIASRTRLEVGRGRRKKIYRASLSTASVLGGLVLSWTNSSRTSEHVMVEYPHRQPLHACCQKIKIFRWSTVSCHPENFFLYVSQGKST
jgi:hypothetical protein